MSCTKLLLPPNPFINRQGDPFFLAVKSNVLVRITESSFDENNDHDDGDGNFDEDDDENYPKAKYHHLFSKIILGTITG